MMHAYFSSQSGIHLALAIATVLLTSALGARASAQQSPPSIDDQLLEDLQPSEDARDSEASGDQSAPAGEDIGAEIENPVVRILQQMERSRDDLARGELAEPTVALQHQIADDLAKLIADLRRQQPPPSQAPAQSSTAGSTSRPSDEQQTSQATEQGTSDQQVAPPAISAAQRVWGHLPEKVREQLMSTASDEFLPRFEELIEAYYRRLAEEPQGLFESQGQGQSQRQNQN